MREPAFWWRPGSGALLSPLGAIYGAVAARRMQSPGRSVGVPVICLGNLTVGGSARRRQHSQSDGSFSPRISSRFF